MPPIPLHIDDPITPKKAEGVTPQTAPVNASAAGIASPASVPATTTAAAGQSPGYSAARPGQAAVPAPTPYLPSPQPALTRTTPTTHQDGPAPPQPGAVPTPFSQQAPRTLPPPPRAGESVQQGTSFTGALNSMHVPPPPQQNYAPTHSTSTYQPPAPSGPTTLNYGPVSSPAAGSYDSRRVSSEHPPGYVQNQYAQELSPVQRASLDAETRRESIAGQLGFGEGAAGGGGYSAGGGYGGGERKSSDGMGGYWDAAKGWMNKAGSALAETEEAVWKRINGH